MRELPFAVDLNMTPAEATGVLESLRWKEDSAVVNHFGEFVYLGPFLDDKGKQAGITECCWAVTATEYPTGGPCPKHSPFGGPDPTNGFSLA